MTWGQRSLCIHLLSSGSSINAVSLFSMITFFSGPEEPKPQQLSVLRAALPSNSSFEMAAGAESMCVWRHGHFPQQGHRVSGAEPVGNVHGKRKFMHFVITNALKTCKGRHCLSQEGGLHQRHSLSLRILRTVMDSDFGLRNEWLMSPLSLSSEVSTWPCLHCHCEFIRKGLKVTNASHSIRIGTRTYISEMSLPSNFNHPSSEAGH